MSKRKWKWLVLIICIITAGVITGLSRNDQDTSTKSISETYFIFDTVVKIKVYGDSVTNQHVQDIHTLLKQIDQELSRTLPNSDIYRVNQLAGISEVSVSQDTYEVVQKALDYAVQTQGLYDPTIGPLVSLWNIGNEGAHVPAKSILEQTMKLVDYKDVMMNKDKQTIKLGRKGMALDLGGIGKGYAADRIAAYLHSKQLDNAIINLGGSSIIAMGNKPGGQSWNIGLQDPDQSRGTQLGTVQIINKTIDASGVYERFFIENGVRYHHILDPRTGYPTRNGLKSVTIISESATDADALSTAVFIMGLEQGMKYIESLPGIEAFFITEDNQIKLSPGLQGQISFTNPEYHY